MKLKCRAFGALCALEEFVVNGIEARESDFGEHHDTEPNKADDYCCGNMQFSPKPATQKILDKYNINVDEYNEICEKLDEQLSFGSCGWCS